MRQRNASRPDRSRHRAGDLLRAGGAVIARNPIAVGATTAVLVTFCFVSANALWYQPHGHLGALFPTRTLHFKKYETTHTSSSFLPVPETRSAIPRDKAPPPANPTVGKVQEILSDLHLYAGPIDGIAGPQTREAIVNYQRIVGLDQSGEIDDRLLVHLGAGPKSVETAARPPVPKPRPELDEAMTASVAPEDEKPSRAARVVRIQAGLRAFGNDQVEIDGIVGEQTSAAIREFQSLFGLEVTGNADEAVLVKMRELGLAD